MIKEQGGVSYLPHPYDLTRKGVKDEKLAAKVDIVEVFNARCPLNSYNTAAEELAKKKKKLIGVGSDTHFLFEFGKTFVEVKDFDLDEPKALLEVLKNAKVHTHKAPMYVRGSTLVLKYAKKFLHGIFKSP